MPASTVRSALFWLGLPLLPIGMAISAIFLPLVVVGGPVFLVGLILVWASDQPVWARLLATGLPFAGWLGVAATALALAPREPATTFLIPEGFEGHIRLVLGEPCGLPPERTDGRLVYRVPAHGVIISQNPFTDRTSPYYRYPNRGYYAVPDNEYYVVDRAGHRLRELTELSSFDGNATRAWRGVAPDQAGAFPNSPITMAPDTLGFTYTFQDVVITSFNRLHHPTLDRQAGEQLALVDRLLPRCRQRGGAPPARIDSSALVSFDTPAQARE